MTITEDLLASLYTEDPKVDAAIAKLGPTRETVADMLHEMGIKGRHDSVGCPLYNYLVREGCMVRFVGHHHVGVGLNRVRIPAHLTSFIMAFDNGWYPQLDVDG